MHGASFCREEEFQTACMVIADERTRVTMLTQKVIDLEAQLSTQMEEHNAHMLTACRLIQGAREEVALCEKKYAHAQGW